MQLVLRNYREIVNNIVLKNGWMCYEVKESYMFNCKFMKKDLIGFAEQICLRLKNKVWIMRLLILYVN